MRLKSKFWAAAIVSAALLSGPAFAQDDDSAPALSPPAPEFVLSEAPEDHVIGDNTAPVTLIVYASVTCPHCSEWFTHEWPKVKSDLVETGKIRFVFRPLPTAPQQLSMIGFVIAECAPKDKYFDVIEYQMENRERIFEQAKAGEGRKAYEKVAKIAGLTEDGVLQSCLSDPEKLTHIHDSSERATAGKIAGVPAFFINGDIYSGPQDAQALITHIDEMNAQGLSKLPADLP